MDYISINYYSLNELPGAEPSHARRPPLRAPAPTTRRFRGPFAIHCKLVATVLAHIHLVSTFDTTRTRTHFDALACESLIMIQPEYEHVCYM